MTQERDIFEEYIEAMEGVNERRLALSLKQLELDKTEMQLFNELRHRLFRLDGWNRYGISQDTDALQAPRYDDMPPDWAQSIQ